VRLGIHCPNNRGVRDNYIVIKDITRLQCESSCALE